MGSLDISPRHLLIFFALGFQIAAHLFLAFSLEVWQSLFTILGILLWLIWFAVVFVMAIPAVDKFLRPYLKHLKWSAIGVCLVLCLIGITEIVGIHLLNSDELEADGGIMEMADTYSQGVGYNDGTAMIHVAGEQLLEAKNPYTEVNLFETIDRFELSLESLTPLKDGEFADVFPYPTDEELHLVWQEAKTNADIPPAEFESKIAYPAGSFLFTTPFLAVGLEDLRYFYLLCALLTFGVIMWQSPRKLRPLVILVAVTSLEMWTDIAFGGTGSLYLLFLLLGWIMLPRNIWLSAVFMGLAVTSKQLAWFFIPFYLVLLLRQFGWWKSFKLGGVIGGVFFVTNMPFIYSAPQAWAESLLAPLIDPMFPGGEGFINFSIAGLIPPATSMIYVLIEVGVLAGGLCWYYYNCRKYPDTALVLAALPLFFAWRSFSIYYYPAVILMFAALVASSRRSIPLTALTGSEIGRQ